MDFDLDSQQSLLRNSVDRLLANEYGFEQRNRGCRLRFVAPLITRRLSDRDALSPDLPTVIADSFAAGTPLLRYLATLG